MDKDNVELLNKELIILRAQRSTLFLGMEAITIFCFLCLGIFDIDRSTSAMNIVHRPDQHITPFMVVPGVFWLLCALTEYFLSLKNYTNNWAWFFRALTIAVIPSCIILKVVFFHVEVYSIDIGCFFLIPICQMTILRHNQLIKLYKLAPFYYPMMYL